MKKSININNNKNKSENKNKAEDMREMKMKKLAENNSKISKQIDRSADSWKSSMEQIRKIAKKSQDSSQILDNVFTENENDRSEMDSDVQKDYQSPMMKEGNFRPVPHYYGPFRPLSQHANQTSVMLNQRYSIKTPDINYRMFSSYAPYAMENNNMKNMNSMINANQSNAYAFNQPPIPKYFYPENRLANPWNGLFNPLSPPIMPPYSQLPNYVPPYQRPYNFYPPQQYSNMLPTNPNYFQPPSVFNPSVNSFRQYHQMRDDTSGIESMKKYVNSLLDKLELLNDTVAQLKNQNQNNDHPVRACSHHFRPRPSFNQEPRENHAFRSPSCCSCVKQTSRNYKSCSCWDVPNVNRRPASSLSETYSQGSGYNCQCNRPERKYSNNVQQNQHSHYQRSQIPPRPHRESPLPIRQQHKHNNFPTNPNYYYTSQPQQNITPNHCFRYSNPPRPPTSSLPIEQNTPGIAVVIDNSNNNNLTNVLVDSSDKSNDLLSMSELADMTDM